MIKKVALFICIGLLASCAPKEKLIARGWKIKDVNLGTANDSIANAFLETVRQQMRTNLLVSMESDSSYAIRQLKEGQVIRGKWWFSADKKQVFFKTDLGLTRARVIKLTPKVLVYETQDPAGKWIKMTFVPTEPAGSK